jgi:hypothetical protein
MTLDLILFRPEFFLLFGFFVLLGYGTGNVVRPISEYLRIPLISRSGQKTDFQRDLLSHISRERKSPRGPNHAVSSLTLWAVLWCRLGAFLIFRNPLHSVVLGGTFQKDAYRASVSVLLLRRRRRILLLGTGWQKMRKICHTEYVYLAM